MQNLNIIISAHNEAEYVKLCIQSIRMFADVENLSVILIDNNSTDGLTEWAMEQDDIAYIQNDDTSLPYGKMINQICELLALEGDLLLLDPHFLLTPSCLSRMMQALYEKESIAAVGPVSNSLYRFHQEFNSVSTYEQVLTWANQEINLRTKRVMALCPEAVLLKGAIFQQVNGYDENILCSGHAITDYCFRMTESDHPLKVCNTAVLWDSRNQYVDIYTTKHDETYLEAKWGMHYFNSRGNQIIIDMITHQPNDPIQVLEIGCDCGATLLEIKDQFPNAQVYGSELNECAANIASHLATVTINNIEEYNLPYPSNTFDYIIFGDVLEHLHAPSKTLEYCRTLLKETGNIIASIPNLMHISVIEDLLKGNFTYTETGLLDKTHIHFFTYNEIQKMFQSCGYEITAIDPSVLKITEEQNILIDQLSALNDTPRFMYETFQYVIRACKKSI